MVAPSLPRRPSTQEESWKSMNDVMFPNFMAKGMLSGYPQFQASAPPLVPGSLPYLRLQAPHPNN